MFGFDIPYLRKRMVINGIVPHKKLCIQNEKPWECSVVDVMNIWKHTSFSCSLDLLSLTLFGESPKTDMSGNNVSAAFYAGNIDMVRKYCEGDVRFTARCYEAIVNPSENGKRATVSDKTSQNTGTNETKNAETPSE
ncbi:MAG: hypothetical protein LBU27_02845 [Candidatus Peribacteria bacterium]|nr:hypothetical protein [Candidatus Peribacteria bacterium]